jgi:hypothetical protein
MRRATVMIWALVGLGVTAIWLGLLIYYYRPTFAWTGLPVGRYVAGGASQNDFAQGGHKLG